MALGEIEVTETASETTASFRAAASGAALGTITFVNQGVPGFLSDEDFMEFVQHVLDVLAADPAVVSVSGARSFSASQAITPTPTPEV